jgi:hypothetical protein
MQSCPNRADGDTKSSGGILTGDPFEDNHHEHLSLLDGDSSENPGRLFRKLAILDQLIGPNRRRCWLGAPSQEVYRPSDERAPVTPHHDQRQPEQPTVGRQRWVVSVSGSCDIQKRELYEIVDLRRGYTQSTNEALDVRLAGLEKYAERMEIAAGDLAKKIGIGIRRRSLRRSYHKTSPSTPSWSSTDHAGSGGKDESIVRVAPNRVGVESIISWLRRRTGFLDGQTAPP